MTPALLLHVIIDPLSSVCMQSIAESLVASSVISALVRVLVNETVAFSMVAYTWLSSDRGFFKPPVQ